jgi:hypothetical protein
MITIKSSIAQASPKDNVVDGALKMIRPPAKTPAYVVKL